jgi:hypothetical protein
VNAYHYRTAAITIEVRVKPIKKPEREKITALDFIVVLPCSWGNRQREIARKTLLNDYVN